MHPRPGGEVPGRTFEPPPQRTVWTTACAAALMFWDRASQDSRVGNEFRTICTANANRLQQVAEHV